MPRKIGIEFDNAHFARIENITRKVQQIYLSTIREAVQISSAVSISDPTKPFTFDSYPQSKVRAIKLLNAHYTAISSILNQATKDEWLAAVEKKDEIAKAYLKVKMNEEQMALRANRNLEALQAFQNRADNGLDLSDRVWNLTQSYKQELEMGLDLGIGDGRSASELSRDLRSYLIEPEKLFRRVRDKHGNLQLSKNAKAYSPGAGTYRSSYKNAMRLTRTEINIAYRASDYEKNQQLDFVVGFEVVRSNNPYPCPVCNALKGKYPKTFKFVGWHPQCRCHVEEILATQDEFINHQNKILSGDENAVLKSANEVTEVPKGFKQWVDDNKERIAGAKERGTLPYFLRDNVKHSGTVLNKVSANSIKFSPAKSIDELTNYLQRVGIENKMTDLPLSMQNSIVEQYTKLNESYGSQIDKIYSYTTGSTQNRELASVTLNRNGNLSLGVRADYFNNSKTINKKLQKAVDEKWNPRDCNTFESLITHEFGHVLSIKELKNESSVFYKEILEIQSDYKQRLLLGRLGDEYVSTYANKSIDEFVSECFAMTVHCKTPSSYAIKVRGVIDKHFKLK